MSGEHYLEDALFTFGYYKDLGERAIAQLSDDELRWKPDAEANSVAILVKHMAGNMRSRWTEFLTTDGEKPDRQRDGEFIDDLKSREAILAAWDDGWKHVLDAVGALEPDDLAREVTIRGRAHTVVFAIQRQIAHYAYHVGQIAYVGRMLRGDGWETLSIAKGKSAGYTPGERL